MNYSPEMGARTLSEEGLYQKLDSFYYRFYEVMSHNCFMRLKNINAYDDRIC